MLSGGGSVACAVWGVLPIGCAGGTTRTNDGGATAGMLNGSAAVLTKICAVTVRPASS